MNVITCLFNLIFLSMFLFFTLVQTSFSACAPRHPFPEHVSYAGGTIKPNNYTQAQMDDHVRTFYDYWKKRYLIRVSGSPVQYRISYGCADQGRTVSEGQGYGMIITALMAGHDGDAQTIFDGLYRYAVSHPSKLEGRFMAWQTPEGPEGEDSAFDGDADIAFALLLAHSQWGSNGPINYLAEAKKRISALKESAMGPDSHLPLLGDWVEIDGPKYNQYTPRTSDFMISHFRSFGQVTQDAFWQDAVQAIQGVANSIQSNYSPSTCLLPDFIQPVSATDHSPRPADDDFLPGEEHCGSFYYNAGRVPFRIGIDALLNNDSRSFAILNPFIDWIAGVTGGNPALIKAGYELDGTPIGDWNTTFFMAPTGVALMTRADKQQFLNDIYDAVHDTHEDYYEDSVTLLCLLVMTGNYWNPDLTSAGPPVYFVAPDGDDNNDGSEQHPWLTIQHAVSNAGPGTTILVKDGVYNEQIIFTASGTGEECRIVLKNYPGASPVIDGSGISAADSVQGLISITDKDYITIQGLEIRNFQTDTPDVTPVGIFIGGSSHNIKLLNNNIHHIATHAPVDGELSGADAHGIAVFGTVSSNSTHSIVIQGNELHHLTLGSSEAVAINGNVEHFTVAGNIIHDCDNIAIDCIGFEGMAPDDSVDQCRNGLIKDNFVYNISSFGNPSYGDVYAASGIYVDGGLNVTIEENVVTGSDIGIEIASEHQGKKSSHILVRNNILHHNALCGIAMGGYDQQRGSTENCVIVNNTLYLNDTLQGGNGEIMLQFMVNDCAILDNIIYANLQGLFIGNWFTEQHGNIVDYNLYFSHAGSQNAQWEWKKVTYEGFTAYKNGTGNDSHSLFSDPLFLSYSGPKAFHVSVHSPAIDAGVSIPGTGSVDMDGQARIVGLAVDLGADEYSGSMAEADIDGDGDVDGMDLFAYIQLYQAGTPPLEPPLFASYLGNNGFCR